MGADSLHREKLHGLQVRAPIRTYPSPNPVLATQPIQTTMAVGLRPSFHGPRRNYGLIIPVPSPQARTTGAGADVSFVRWCALACSTWLGTTNCQVSPPHCPVESGTHGTRMGSIPPSLGPLPKLMRSHALIF